MEATGRIGTRMGLQECVVWAKVERAGAGWQEQEAKVFATVHGIAL